MVCTPRVNWSSGKQNYQVERIVVPRKMELSGTGVGSGPQDEETVKLRWVVVRRMMELSGGGGLKSPG